MYGYTNYQKIKADIEERRLSAIAISEERNELVRERSEKIREIDRELTLTGLKLFRAACVGDDVAPIKERNRELSNMRKKALLDLGYPEDFTEVHYSCEKCSDSGFIDGKMCSCFREALIKENIKSSGMGVLIEKQSFEKFVIDSTLPEEERLRLERIVKTAKDYAQNFKAGNKNLVFLGTTGTGKTHISTSIAKVVIERGFEVLYDTAQNIFSAFEEDKFRSGYGPYTPKGEKYLDCDLLIIDDLGTEFVTQFSTACLYNLINTRINKGLPFIISSNLTNKQLLDTYDSRIVSRIIGSSSLVFVFPGKDKRFD